MTLGFCFGDPAFEGARELADFLHAHANDGFDPVIIGPEPIYTAALSRTYPELIDLYPVYTVPIGLVVKKESSAAGGEVSVRALKAGFRLLAAGKIDTLLIGGLHEESLSLYDPEKPDLFSHLTAFFPGAAIRAVRMAASAPVTLYDGLPGTVLEGGFESGYTLYKRSLQMK